MDIRSTDQSFLNGHCSPFWQEPGPFAHPLAKPGQPFGPGDYKVGYEVAPGRYHATGGPYDLPGFPSACIWARRSSFRLGVVSVIQFGNQLDVTITPGDYGFSSSDCGTWTYVSPF